MAECGLKPGSVVFLEFKVKFKVSNFSVNHSRNKYCELFIRKNFLSFDNFSHIYTIFLATHVQNSWCYGKILATNYLQLTTAFWMFIEGYYLHQRVAVSVFSTESHVLRYQLFAWGIIV